jgi:protein-S-isoprenylcysteine O-methyltransferase Ste14
MSRSRPFTLIAAILFALAALLHIYRLFVHFQVVAGTHTIPETASYVAIVVAGIMAWGLYRESKS